MYRLLLFLCTFVCVFRKSPPQVLVLGHMCGRRSRGGEGHTNCGERKGVGGCREEVRGEEWVTQGGGEGRGVGDTERR